MIWFSHFLRIGVVVVCLVVLSGIVPISLAQLRTGDACPNLGPIPACYIVSVCYGGMAVAAVVWWRNLSWLFFLGVTPVLILAATGTTLELAGRPTCPVSDAGVPLCFVSLAVGCGLLLAFFIAVSLEKNTRRRQIS